MTLSERIELIEGAELAQRECIFAAQEVRRLSADTYGARVLDKAARVISELLAAARKAEALQQEVAELREALKPLAAHQTADGLSGPDSLLYIPDDHPLLFNGLGNDVHVTVTVGHIRRARALLNGGSDAQG